MSFCGRYQLNFLTLVYAWVVLASYLTTYFIYSFRHKFFAFKHFCFSFHLCSDLNTYAFVRQLKTKHVVILFKFYSLLSTINVTSHKSHYNFDNWITTTKNKLPQNAHPLHFSLLINVHHSFVFMPHCFPHDKLALS